MYPLSFYDLRAHYIYTPLYGPYSLSGAIGGLISYSLDESRDSISIGCRRTLHHELISELSHVVDNLQDHLIYFSSTFLISPLNLPDFIRELQVSYSRFEHLGVYWGALIARLRIARQIVEHNFWPHHFHPIFDNPAALQGCRHALPVGSWNKSPVSASTFISPSHMDSIPHSPSSPLESQRLPLLNAQSECPLSTPSETVPTGEEEGRSSSLRLDRTPTPSGSYPDTRVPSNSQRFNIPLESHFPQAYEDRSNKLVAPPNHAVAAQCSRSMISSHVSETRELRNSEDDAKAVGDNGQDSKRIEAAAEEDEVPMVPCVRPHPAQLISFQAEASGERASVPSRTSSPSTALQLSSPAPCISSPSPNFHRGTSTPFPCSFTNAAFRSSTRLCPQRVGRSQLSISSPSFHSPSTIRKQLSKTRTRCFVPSRVSPPTTQLFQQRPLDFDSTHASRDTSRPYRDERQSSKGPLSPVTVNNARDTSLFMHSTPSIAPPALSHNLNQHPASLHPHPLTPFLPKPRCSSLPPTFRQSKRTRHDQLKTPPSPASSFERNGFVSSLTPNTPYSPSKIGQPSFNTRDEQDVPIVDDERCLTTPTSANSCTPTMSASTSSPLIYLGRVPPPLIHENSSNEVFKPRNHTIAARNLCGSSPAHTSETRESRNLEVNAKAVGATGEVSKGIEVAEGGDDLTVVPCVHPYPTRLTSVQAEATGECATVPSRTSSPSTALWPSSPAPSISNAASELHCGSTNPLQPTIPLPHTFSNTVSPPLIHLSPNGQRTQHSVSPATCRSRSTTQKRPSEVFTPSSRTNAAHRSCSSISTHTSDVREPENWKTSAEVGGADGQVTKETKVVEGEEVTRVPCTHLLPIQLIPVRGNAARKLITVPARLLSPPTAMRSMSTAAHSTSNLGSTILFPCPSANASSRRPSHLSSKRRHTQQSAWTTTPFCSLSITQKQQLETQTRRITPSPVSPPTFPSFQQSWPNSYPFLDTSQTCREGRLSPKESPSSISVSSASDTSSSLRHVPSISLPHSSCNLYRYPASFHSCPSPSFPKRRSSSLPPTFCHDEQVQANASSSPDVPTVDKEGCPSSTMCDSNPTSVPTTPTSPSSILWGPEPAEASAASPTTLDNASDPSLPIHNGRPVSHVTHFHNVYRYPTPSPSLKAYQPGPDTRDDHLETLWLPAASTVENEDCMSPLMPNARTPSPSSRLSPGTLNEQIQTEALSLPEVPTVDSKQCLSLTTPCGNSTSFPTTPTPLSILWRPEPAEASAASQTKNQPMSMKFDTPLPDNDDATIHSPNSVLLHDSELQPKCLAQPTMPAILGMESEPKATQRLGMEEVFEKSPMAQLIQAIESQFGPTERSITLVLSLEELTPDLIVDRGKARARKLPRYHLVKAMMNNLTMVVTVQQIFLQQAAALIVDRKSYFIVDPGDTLIPILQGTSSLPQLYTVWRALITRIKLGVKAGEKYIAEYQLQESAATLSLSTLHC